jgi:translocation and assembly module TamA
MRTVRGFVVLALLLACAPALAEESRLQVRIEGVSGELLENVRAFLSIERERERVPLSEARIRRAHARAPLEIQQALQPFGRYRPQIESDLRREDGLWVAEYRIDAGPPVRIAELDLRLDGTGVDDPEFLALLRRFPIGQGQVLDHTEYERAKRELRQVALDRGYFDARMPVHEVRVQLEPYEAQVRIHFDTGPRYRFGEVVFEEEHLSPQFLERFVPFDTGDPFSSGELFELQTGLIDSAYFSHVEVEPRHDLAVDGHVPVHVRLEERPRNIYTFGLGYGTDTGPRVSAGFERRRVNRFGHRLLAETEVSQIRNRITGRYIIPGRAPRTDYFAITTSWIDDDTGPLDSETLLLGGSLTRLRGDGWQETFSLNFQHERFTVAEVSDTAQLLMPGANWIRVEADDRIYTTRGWRLLLDLRGAAEGVLSDISFLQGRVQGALIRPVASRGRLITRADFGYTVIDELTDLPGSLRFFAGGDQSVRGYGFQQLGPQDEAGNVIGGRHLLVASVEYEHRITGPWSAAVFYDVGNAFNTLDDLTDRVRHGAGVGARWRSPVGLVRVDIATALDEPGTPIRLHLMVGPDL